MANKSNKNRQLSWRKEARGKKPWPNLPPQLLGYIGRQPYVLDNISYPGSIKALRLKSRRCQNNMKNPQLAELVDVGISDWSAQREITLRYINIHIREEYYWPHCGSHPEFWEPGFMPLYSVGCGHGVVVSRHNSPSEYILRDIASRDCWHVPNWDVNVPLKFVLINESPVSSKFCLPKVFTGISNPAFAFCWLNPVHVWEKRGCTIINPNDLKLQFMKFGTAIASQGKIYALSMQGTVVVIEVIGTDVATTAISKCRAVPSVNTGYFRECLIESNGEILLVFLTFQKTMTIVDHIEVFKLQLPKLRWVKMEILGDRALFVEPESCIWVKASQFGCKSNCVFFSTTIVEWWTYDLKSDTTSSSWSKNS
ncbi:hypothetical protein P8452_73403 [Trifolium repens]|nr:hypothetical protein P8452_73403 [Trifolium repens]